MIKIRLYEHTDRYQLENMIKSCYIENKLKAPSPQNIIDTIGFFTTFPQTGGIYMMVNQNDPIGYAIIQNLWRIKYGGISFMIDELYIIKSFRKHKPEINLIEYLVKQDRVHSIEIKLDQFKSTSRRIFRFFKFNRDFGPYFTKQLIEEDS